MDHGRTDNLEMSFKGKRAGCITMVIEECEIRICCFEVVAFLSRSSSEA